MCFFFSVSIKEHFPKKLQRDKTLGFVHTNPKVKYPIVFSKWKMEMFNENVENGKVYEP